MAQAPIQVATPSITAAGQPKPVCQDVQIHAAGELYIVTPIKRFQVHPTALRLSSSVFSRMLDPTSPFCEGQLLAFSTEDSPASVTLKEDDPEALEVILNIAHFNGHLVPTTLKPKMLFAVASLCDKYDMAKALRGYSRLWTNKVKVQDIQGSCAMRWLAAACEFKNEVLFKFVTAYLVKHVKYKLKGPPDKGNGAGKDEEVILIFYDGTELDTDRVPPKVLGMFSKVPYNIYKHTNMQNLQDALRIEATTLHESLVSLAFDHVMPYLTTKTVLCKEKAPSCDRLQLGIIMHFMLSTGISTLDLWVGQHLMMAPNNPPLVSAYEYMSAFDKMENLSKHTACGVLRKVYKDTAQRYTEVCGLAGFM